MTPDQEERWRFLVSCLESHSGVFARFAEAGRVYFTRDIPTACVTFTKEGEHINFQWNPDFFDRNSNYTNLFIFCHEMLHILLGHGPRGKDLKNRRKANVTMDISINHMLVEVFGFCRAHIDGWEKLCWRDTVFNRSIDPQPSFEGYYNVRDEYFNKGFQSIDGHEFLDFEGGIGGIPDFIKDKIDDMRGDLSNQLPNHGDGSGDNEELVAAARSRKKKFETLIKNLTSSMKSKSDIKEDYSWGRIDRRLAMAAPDLPAYSKVFDRAPDDRFKCLFFIDNSGSCKGFLQRFCDAAAGLNEKVFEVEVYSFDTKLNKVEQEKSGAYKVRGGGGTSFTPVIKHIEESEADIVFILTDGEAEKVENTKKRITHWFLTENGRANAIAGAGHVWRLSQFA